MVTLIDRIRAALRRPTSTTAQLADALADARKADVEALAAVERQVAAVAAGYLDPDEKRAAARSRLADLRADAEDSSLVLAEAKRRHAAAVAADEQDRRRAVYAGAKQLADDAALELAKTYPRLAAGMIALLKDLAVAQQSVDAANADLPDGVMPLMDPEMAARGAFGLPGEVVSDEWVEAWGRVDLGVPVDESFRGEIYDCGSGCGKRVVPDHKKGSASMGDPTPNFRRRRFHKIVTREAENGDWPIPIAAALQLPAIRGSGVLWGESFPAVNSAISAVMMGQAEPGAVLARIAEIDAAAVARPVKVERPLRVEYPEYAEVVPFPAEQPMESRAGKPSGVGSRFGASPFAAPGARAGARR